VYRTLLSALALATLSLPCRADQTVTSTETLIRLNLQPMPAPKPALRYLLLPELREMSPGNPIPNYMKCLIDPGLAASGATLGTAALKQADRAARLDKPDWQILLRMRTDGVNLLLPDLQKHRELAAGLKERFHEEVAQRRFDDALVTAKTMFAMARHVGEHPTLIGDLVGIAIASIAIGPLEEMLDQPGCPNLYWALTNLPHPFIAVDKGIEGERMLLLAELRDLDDVSPMSPDQIKKLIPHLDKLRALGNGKNPDTDVRGWLDARIKDEKNVQAARERLIEFGMLEERIAKFPAEQVILLDEKREYQVRRDDEMKIMVLPTWQVEGMLARPKPSREPALFDFLLPAMGKVRQAQGRLEQRIGLLRCIEALRLYAAEHNGKFPEKLEDCPVPVPPDSFTGKPFRYEVIDGTAHLRGSPPKGHEKTPVYNLHYELTIRK
jgi:hypothetical protein